MRAEFIYCDGNAIAQWFFCIFSFCAVSYAHGYKSFQSRHSSVEWPGHLDYQSGRRQ